MISTPQDSTNRDDASLWSIPHKQALQTQFDILALDPHQGRPNEISGTIRRVLTTADKDEIR